MKNLLVLLAFFLLLGAKAQHKEADYYVAVNGDDNNPGTYDEPWETWQKAFSTAQPGDTVYFRGGTWYPTSVVPATNSVVLHSPSQQPIRGHNGTAEKRICFFNYPGEKPVLDCIRLDTIGRRFNGAISLTGSSFLHIKGLTIKNVLQPRSRELASGIGASECSNLIFENLSVSNIGGRGMSYWGIAGHPEAAHMPFDTTKYINCDVFNCVDSLSEVPGNGSDGWKLDNESAGYLYFYGCRAWNCGDDGFDISGPGVTIFDHCWSFGHSMPGALDANGFKFGANRGDGAYIDKNGKVVLGTPVEGVRRTVKNCIAANNAGVGYYDLGYEPYYPNNSRVFNNVSYANGIGIFMATNDAYSGQNPSVYKNNIIYKPTETDAGGRPYFLVVGDIYIESHNNWDYADDTVIGSLMWWQPTDSVTVTDDDFLSLDASQLSRPRKSDGSLPEITFMKLAEGSDLIDAGTNVGLPFYGAKPDIGYAEYNPNPMTIHNPAQQADIMCFPNPTSDFVEVRLKEKTNSFVRIRLINNNGRVVYSKNIKSAYTANNIIDLKPYPDGIYFLVIDNDRGFHCTKILKR